MKEGRLLDVNQRAAQIIRFAGLIAPVSMLFYAILLQMGALSTPPRIDNVALAGIGMLTVALAVYQFLFPCRTVRSMAIIMAGYHLLFAVYCLFIIGFASPFASLWVLLLLASYIYHAKDGLYLSIFTFFAVSIADMLLHMDDQSYVVLDLISVVGTLIVAVIAVSLAQTQEIDRQELTRSQAEEILQRDRVLTIVNNLADAIIGVDRGGTIQFYNAASLNLLDTNSDLSGKRIDDVLKMFDDDKKSFSFVRNLKKATSVVTRDDLSATIAEETVHLSVIYSPIRSNDSHEGTTGDDGYIVILRDITKQKSLEEERDEFISVVSHELRTPITIAEGSLSNAQLMMAREDIPRSTIASGVDMAHEQVVFLARMVNDLSTLSRAERGVADTPEVISVGDMIHDLYNEYAPQAEAKGLKFNLDMVAQPGNVNASRLYLKELLQNFVTNAIKYTKSGEVTVIVTKDDANNLTFAVKDSGIGISKSDQKRIFEKFFRSEDYRTRETGGTGLGLYVSVKLAKKLGTRIELTSRLNHGSTFSFELPQYND